MVDGWLGGWVCGCATHPPIHPSISSPTLLPHGGLRHDFERSVVERRAVAVHDLVEHVEGAGELRLVVALLLVEHLDAASAGDAAGGGLVVAHPISGDVIDGDLAGIAPACPALHLDEDNEALAVTVYVVARSVDVVL